MPILGTACLISPRTHWEIKSRQYQHSATSNANVTSKEQEPEAIPSVTLIYVRK